MYVCMYNLLILKNKTILLPHRIFVKRKEGNLCAIATVLKQTTVKTPPSIAGADRSITPAL